MSPFMIKLNLAKRPVLVWCVLYHNRVKVIFPFFVTSGLQFAPASDAGALAPGMIPIWTAIALILSRESGLEI